MTSPPATQPTASPDRSRATRLRRFGILCMLTYVALSWAVRFDMRRGDQIASLVYPLDTFSMYAYRPAEHIHHLLVRDRQGVARRVTFYRSYQCEEPVRGDAVRCADRRGYQYHYDDLTNYIVDHPGPGDVDVELISRTWEVLPGSAPRHTEDCVISRCRVSQ